MSGMDWGSEGFGEGYLFLVGVGWGSWLRERARFWRVVLVSTTECLVSTRIVLIILLESGSPGWMRPVS